MLLETSRPRTGSLIVTFDGHVVETLNGLEQGQIEQLLALVKANSPAPEAKPRPKLTVVGGKS